MKDPWVQLISVDLLNAVLRHVGCPFSMLEKVVIVVYSRPWCLGLRLLTNQRLCSWIVDQSEVGCLSVLQMWSGTTCAMKLLTIVFGLECSSNHWKLAKYQVKQAIKPNKHKWTMKYHCRRVMKRNGKGNFYRVGSKSFCVFVRTQRRAQYLVLLAGSSWRKQTCQLK